MGTIDKSVFENAGARGCSNSDYNIVKTTCCNAYMVEDSELNDVYYDSADLKKKVDITYSGECPVCGSKSWDYYQLPEWPRERTYWQWAYPKDQEVVNEWLKKNP